MAEKIKNGRALRILFAVAGVGMAVYGTVAHRDDSRVRDTGRPATADHVAAFTRHSMSGHVSFSAEIHFKTDDGRDVVATQVVPDDIIRDFESRRPVRVVYLPEEPSSFVFEKDAPGWTVVVIGVILAAAAVFLG
jgi:hypothetical protein